MASSLLGARSLRVSSVGDRRLMGLGKLGQVGGAWTLNSEAQIAFHTLKLQHEKRLALIWMG